MATFEAVVTLTPLNSTDDISRKIELSSTNNKIYVGRASKNEGKGLLASKDNAWFDSPIMSRQHAMLSMSILPKRITIQDCNSTHGTFLADKRLAPHIPHELNIWDIVTFGARVTSGRDIFPAREFSVELEWKTPMSSSKSTTTLAIPLNTGFQVPEEEQDSSSEISVADSLQILKSHPRTYSVPSSDDGSADEDEIDDSLASKPSVDSSKGQPEVTIIDVQQPKMQDKTIPHPDRNDPLPSTEAPVSVGNCQANPIDLDSTKSRPNCFDYESDSDDSDEADILSIASKSTHNKTPSPKSDLEPNSRASCTSTEDPETTDIPQALNKEPVKEAIKEPLKEVIKEPVEESVEAPVKQPVKQMLTPIEADECLASDWDSDEPDDVDYDASDNDIPIKGGGIHTGIFPSSHQYPKAKPFSCFPIIQPSVFSHPGGYSRPQNGSIKGAAGFERNFHAVKQAGTASKERAPSPSDAALARKASVAKAAWENTSMDTDPRYPNVKSYPLTRAPPNVLAALSSSTAPDASLSHGMYDMSDKAYEDNITRDTARAMRDRIAKEKDEYEAKMRDQRYQNDKYLKADMEARRHELDQQQRKATYVTEHQKPRNEPSLLGVNEAYLDGTFASKPLDPWGDAFGDWPGESQRQSYPFGPFSTTRESFEKGDHSFYATQGTSPYDYIRQPNGTFSTYSPFDQVDAWNTPDPSGPRHRHAEWLPSQGPAKCAYQPPISMPVSGPESASKPSAAQPPRVPIGTLLTPPNGLNSVKTPQPEILTPPKSLKRKADLLEVDSEVAQDSIDEEALPTPKSQQSVLPDAQPREEPPVAAESTITQTSQDSFVLEGKGSSQSQLNALAARETTGPARKKARTVSSKTGGIAKFVGGVCFGVIGVLAAFVATIPDSVREEAIREIAKTQL